MILNNVVILSFAGTTSIDIEPKPYPTQQNAPPPSAPSQTEPPLNPTVQIVDPNQKEPVPSSTSPQDGLEDDQKPSGSGQKPHKKKRRKHKKEGETTEGEKDDKGADSGRKKKHRKKRPKNKTPEETEELPEEQTTDANAPLVDQEDSTPSSPPVQETETPSAPSQETEAETEADSNKPLLSSELPQANVG